MYNVYRLGFILDHYSFIKHRTELAVYQTKFFPKSWQLKRPKNDPHSSFKCIGGIFKNVGAEADQNV